ncbi:MAG: hypothetical protein R2749_04310 [Acidimicrobiales bacterium]
MPTTGLPSTPPASLMSAMAVEAGELRQAEEGQVAGLPLRQDRADLQLTVTGSKKLPSTATSRMSAEAGAVTYLLERGERVV